MSAASAPPTPERGRLMATDQTAQDLGRAWDREVARRTGGRAHPGSGNGVLQLDSRTGLLLIEAKLTSHASISLSPAMLEQARAAVVGPEAMTGGYDSILALKVGATSSSDLAGPALAVVDLDLLISWLRSPPEIVASTKRDDLRATARTPSIMR